MLPDRPDVGGWCRCVLWSSRRRPPDAAGGVGNLKDNATSTTDLADVQVSYATVVTGNWSYCYLRVVDGIAELCRGRLFRVFQVANDHRWDNYRWSALFVQPRAPCWPTWRDWLMSGQRRMCTTVGGALSETVATVTLRTEKMLSMLRLWNKKCSATGPNPRCSGPEQYQKRFWYNL